MREIDSRLRSFRMRLLLAIHLALLLLVSAVVLGGVQPGLGALLIYLAPASLLLSLLCATPAAQNGRNRKPPLSSPSRQ